MDTEAGWGSESGVPATNPISLVECQNKSVSMLAEGIKYLVGVSYTGKQSFLSSFASNKLRKLITRLT